MLKLGYIVTYIFITKIQSTNQRFFKLRIQYVLDAKHSFLFSKENKKSNCNYDDIGA